MMVQMSEQTETFAVTNQSIISFIILDGSWYASFRQFSDSTLIFRGKF